MPLENNKNEPQPGPNGPGGDPRGFIALCSNLTIFIGMAFELGTFISGLRKIGKSQRTWSLNIGDGGLGIRDWDVQSWGLEIDDCDRLIRLGIEDRGHRIEDIGPVNGFEDRGW